MKFIILVFTLFSINSYAGPTVPKNSNSINPSQTTIKVQGMVCAFCAQGVEKNFNAEKEVKKTKVNLDDMTVTITFRKDQSLTKEKIKNIIESAGFNIKTEGHKK